MALTADQTYAQVRWEQSGVERGVRRYREAAEVADPTTLPPGQALLREVVPPLVEAIRALQAEARTGGAGQGMAAPWTWMIHLLPPEKIGVVVASTLLRVTAGDGGQVTTTARTIGTTLRCQVEMDRWVRQMTEAREVGVWDALASFRTRYPNADTRTWRAWRKRIEGLETEPWTAAQTIHLGARLVHLATEACPTWFALEVERVGQKTHSVIVLSERAKEQMEDLTVRAELANPTRLPMIVPPLAWRYEDQGEAP